MGRWLLARGLQALLTLAIAATLAFLLMRLAPGDPLAALQGDRPLPPGTEAALRARYGLDQPAGRQYLQFLSGAVRGDLGTSIATGRPVTELLASRLGPTLLLGGTVLLLNFTLGVLLGSWQAIHRGSLGDRLLGGTSLVLHAVPSFWLGLVLSSFVAVRWQLLPAAGMSDPLLALDATLAERMQDVLRHLVLPALTLVLVTIGSTMRYQRAAMLDALAMPFIVGARARGLPERTVRWRHAFRNALGPILALFGLWLPIVVTGSVFVEFVFAWPGLGQLAAQAVGERDYPVVMGVTLLVAAVTVIGTLLADLLHVAADPRLRPA